MHWCCRCSPFESQVVFASLSITVRFLVTIDRLGCLEKTNSVERFGSKNMVVGWHGFFLQSQADENQVSFSVHLILSSRKPRQYFAPDNNSRLLRNAIEDGLRNKEFVLMRQRGKFINCSSLLLLTIDDLLLDFQSSWTDVVADKLWWTCGRLTIMILHLRGDIIVILYSSEGWAIKLVCRLFVCPLGPVCRSPTHSTNYISPLHNIQGYLANWQIIEIENANNTMAKYEKSPLVKHRLKYLNNEFIFALQLQVLFAVVPVFI